MGRPASYTAPTDFGAQVAVGSQPDVEVVQDSIGARRVTVHYFLPGAASITATLLDVSGRTVWSWSRRPQDDGAALGIGSPDRGSFTLDARGLSPGVYILKLESGNTSLTRELAIQ